MMDGSGAENSVPYSSPQTDEAPPEADLTQLENCITYFDSSAMGSYLTEPFSAIEEYIEQAGPFPLQVVAYNTLMEMDRASGKAPSYTEQGVPYYPSALCDALTSQMFGFVLDWGGSETVPDGMSCMPYGYGSMMVTATALKEESYIVQDRIYIVVNQLYHEYGEPAQPIQKLAYEFQYHAENTLCPYMLVAIHAQ